MKKLIVLTALILIQSGCTVLRYNFEPALNQVAKQGTVTKITNDYIEYNQHITNTAQVTYVVTNTYRAYYTTDGKVFETKQIK